MMRYAAALAPDAFGDFFEEQPDGTYKLLRLPADSDPMMDRIRRIGHADFSDGYDAVMRIPIRANPPFGFGMFQLTKLDFRTHILLSRVVRPGPHFDSQSSFYLRTSQILDASDKRTKLVISSVPTLTIS